MLCAGPHSKLRSNNLSISTLVNKSLTIGVKDNYICLHKQQEFELQNMTMSHLHNSHTYTSLKDILDTSSPIGSKQHLNAFHSLPDIHHVRMKNPLVEKAAKIYLAVGNNIQQEQHPVVQPSSLLSSFLKTIQSPFGITHRSFHKVWGGAFIWLWQMCINCWRRQIILHCGYGWRIYTMWHHDGYRLMMKVAWSKPLKWCSFFNLLID